MSCPLCFCFIHDSLDSPRDPLYSRMKPYEHAQTLVKHQYTLATFLERILFKLSNLDHNSLALSAHQQVYSELSLYFTTQEEVYRSVQFAEKLLDMYRIHSYPASEDIAAFLECLRDIRFLREGKQCVEPAILELWILEYIVYLKYSVTLNHSEHTAPTKPVESEIKIVRIQESLKKKAKHDKGKPQKVVPKPSGPRPIVVVMDCV